MAVVKQYRSKETIHAELKETRYRLDMYLAREEEMLSKDGVQMYTIGSRNLQRYQTALAEVQDMIEKTFTRDRFTLASVGRIAGLKEKLTARAKNWSKQQ